MLCFALSAGNIDKLVMIKQQPSMNEALTKHEPSTSQAWTMHQPSRGSLWQGLSILSGVAKGETLSEQLIHVHMVSINLV